MNRSRIAGLTLVVILLNASAGYSQSSGHSTQVISSSERLELLIKAEQAADEVLKSRTYITELEEQLKATDARLVDTEKLAALSKEEIEKLKAERDELQKAVEYWKRAETERIKEMTKVLRKLERVEAEKRFWRKLAVISTGVLAAGVAAVVLLK